MNIIKKMLTLALSLIFVLACASFVAAADKVASGGYTGPGSTPSSFYWLSSNTKDATTLADDTLVTLEGNIVRALGDERYMFADASGEILIEIDTAEWTDRKISEKDTIKIYGEIDKDDNKTEIDVVAFILYPKK